STPPTSAPSSSSTEAAPGSPRVPSTTSAPAGSPHTKHHSRQSTAPSRHRKPGMVPGGRLRGMGEVGLPAQARRILELARRDRDEAKRALAALSVDEQVALVCETPVSRRGELMDLLPHPEAVVPRMPEAELCFTVKAIGLGDAAWLLAHATDDQMRAAIDLDAWRDDTPDTKQLGEWIGALREAGDEALLRAAHALDPELWMLWLAD